MRRFFFKIQYDGADFVGWQSQPGMNTVQRTLEEKFSIIFQENIPIVGCGRTDSGVHASSYFFHADFDVLFTKDHLFKLNLMLPKSIAILDFQETESNAHARFDATQRSYKYNIHRVKNPFIVGHSYHFPHLWSYDLTKLNETAELLLKYNDFFPFCKTRTDVKTTICHLSHCNWEISEDRLQFQIGADRFLRGMVRLIVGACINVTRSMIDLSEIELALKERRRLIKDLSVPAEGLFLSEVLYQQTLHTMGS